MKFLRHFTFLITGLLFFHVQAGDYLVSSELVRSHTKSTLKALWKENRIPKIIMPVKNDVDIYEIIYRVPWIDSTWRTASGIVYVPKGLKNPCLR